MLCVLPSWWQLSCPLSFTFKSQLEHQSPWTICSDNCLLFPLVLLITMYCNHPFTFITVSTDLGVLLVAQWVKHLPAMWETWVWFSGWEVPLEKEMAIHSGTLAWKIPWTEEPSGLQSVGLPRVEHDWATSLPPILPSERDLRAHFAPAPSL